MALSSIFSKLNTVCSGGGKINIVGGCIQRFLNSIIVQSKNYIKIHAFQMRSRELKSRNTLITRILINLMLKKVVIPSRVVSNTVNTTKNMGKIQL